MKRRTILQMMASIPLATLPKISSAATEDRPLWVNFRAYESSVLVSVYSKPNCRGWLFGLADVEWSGGVRKYLSKLESRGAPTEYQGGVLAMRKAIGSQEGMENFLLEQGFTKRYCRELYSVYTRDYETVNVTAAFSRIGLSWHFYKRPELGRPILSIHEFRDGTCA